MLIVENGGYQESEAWMTVWKPFVEQDDEISASQMWISSMNEEERAVNAMEAGWQVNPALYGDENTRLFIYWTGDGYDKTGCYDLKCESFVQTSSKTAVGAAFNHYSTPRGPEYKCIFLIRKDRGSENWWLLTNNHQVGYWPNSLFPLLKDTAPIAAWGGEIKNVYSRI
ncbi:PREDICTED: uncharacterized protein LOC104811325 [Tarenaya hassleriana]|uniref:uncharacterized protein LOC104811325 n=1 Tax=Tarenaya hassleriana TaxID=28532 RepID=UPI00053C4E5C|nr:PREDICTED: uncharacterized protein LOC104811325 [Tarenaya hassleriana]